MSVFFKNTPHQIVKGIALGGMLIALSACDQSNSAATNANEQAVEVTTSTEKVDSSYTFSRTEDGGYVIGAEDAPVSVIEYASFTCGACANFHETAYPRLLEKYINTGKVRFEMRSYLRAEPDFYATLVMSCAPAERFEALADLFFDNQREWLTSGDYNGYVETLAKRAGFSASRYQQCITDEDARKTALNTTQRGNEVYKINATPTVIVDGEVLQMRDFWLDLDRAIQSAL